MQAQAAPLHPKTSTSTELLLATLGNFRIRPLVMNMVIYSALVRSHQSIYLSGSFGLVRPPKI